MQRTLYLLSVLASPVAAQGLPDASNPAVFVIALCGKDYNSAQCRGAKLTETAIGSNNWFFSVLRHGTGVGAFDYSFAPFGSLPDGQSYFELDPSGCGPVATYCPFLEVLQRDGKVVDYGVFQLPQQGAIATSAIEQTVTPEPATVALFSSGLSAIALARRRRKISQRR